MTCCKSSNPLRRDGTSQKQRFPLALSESYVQIDERSFADILNFTRGLAGEFLYYDLGNSIDGRWTEFFELDLSFLLARMAELDLGAYKADFAEKLQQVQALYTEDPITYPALLAALEGLFQGFLAPINTFGGDVLAPLPKSLSDWAGQLPGPESFAEGHQFTFKDLILDAIKRLSVILRRVQVAHAEFARRYSLTVDNTGWSGLVAGGWDLLGVPPTLPVDDEDLTYLNSAVPDDDLEGVFELLRLTHDSIVGMVDALQSAIPQYLLQSFQSYGAHDPQNALFVAFMLLFKHAQDHINTLGRKHLLYFYKDVLRFKERSLVGDEAVVVMRLRKGVPSYVIAAGTLLNGGKDNGGKPRYFAATVETVINQAQVASVKTLFVERRRGAVPPSDLAFEVVEGVYAAPVAKSADGKGADLPADEPKWSLLGSPQRTLSPEARTMPDAELGFAVASPLFLMKEGRREIVLNYLMDTSFFKAYLLATPMAPGLAELEAAIVNGMRVQYTAEKGWFDATVERLFLVDSDTVANHADVKPQLDFATNPAWSTNIVLSIKVVLYEGMPPCVAYDEAVHQRGMYTKWPVLRFTFYNRSVDFRPLAIKPYIGNNNSLINGTLRLFGGRVYKYPLASGNTTRISELSLETDMGSVYDTRVTDNWSSVSSYNYLRVVKHDGGRWVVRAQTARAGMPPRPDNTDWAPLTESLCLYDWLRWFSPEQLNIKVEVTGMRAFVLENDFGKLKTNKPFQPFGPAPVVGSRLYIGAKEIFGKKLDKLSFDITWLDPPQDIASHYGQYEPFYSASDRSMTFAQVSYSPGYYSPVTPPVVVYNPPPFVAAPYLPQQNFAETSGVMSYVGPTAHERSLPPNQQVTQANQAEAAPANIAELDFAPNNRQWTADFSLLYEGVWVPLANTQRRTLFYHPASTGLGAKTPITITFSDMELGKFARDLDLGEPDQLKSNTPRGFLRMELATPAFAFGHKHYRDLYVKEAMRVAKSTPPTTPVFPGEPYIPVMKELKISYLSRASMGFGEDYASEEDFHSRVEQFFHVHPFGHTEEHPYISEPDRKPFLVPYYGDEGHLFVGLQDLDTPCTLSVLFQLAEGTADPDLDRMPLTWSYLQHNHWKAMPVRKVLIDTTEGMISSGVIRFELDAEMVSGNTVLDSGLHWLRASVSRDTAAYLKAIDIVAQAVLVQFEDQGNEISHLAKALPSDTIKSFKVTDPQVKSVAQPYASFDGKLPEQSQQFLTRVSERLRHKQRSINIWDYERMVLEEFPSIYKVKCLNHTELQAGYIGGRDWEISPGHVTVVCIPDLRNVNAVNPFAPKSSLRVLRKIDNFLRTKVSPWVDLRVSNPLYEELKITCKVGFLAGKDPGFYLLELERELQQFLSPWAFDHQEEIVFGGRIHRSHIIRFIEQRDYVDYVIDFRLQHSTPAGLQSTVVEAIATTGRSILVSAAAHSLTSIDATCEDCTVELPAPDARDCGCATITPNNSSENAN